jgi:CRP/FNR family transcriptional regulator, cyclic AMP receptor protein
VTSPIPFTPLKNGHEVFPILSQIAIFGATTEIQQQEIFRRLETGLIPKGQPIFHKGDDASHIYIVKSGEIELSIPGNDVTIQKKKLGVGECFGQVALMSMQPHAVSAIAGEDSEVIVLSRRALHQLRHEDIELFALLMMNIAREMARRLIFTDKMLLDSFHTDEKSRLAALTGK